MIKLKDILTERKASESKAFKAVEDNLQHIAYQFAEINPRFLGSGYWGRAYQTDAGRVLKVTSDPQEVAIASRFKKLSSRPHIVGIYDVRPIKRVTIPFGSDGRIHDVFPDGYYVIHMDAVTPLESYKDGKIAEVWEKQFLHRMFLREDLTDQQIRDRFDRIAEHYGVFEDYDRLMDQRKKILQDAKAVGLSVSEAHSGNVGFNQHGNFVIYDMQSKRYADRSGPNPNNLGRPVDLTPDDMKYDWTGIMDGV
jgi:hypothetical protein